MKKVKKTLVFLLLISLIFINTSIIFGDESATISLKATKAPNVNQVYVTVDLSSKKDIQNLSLSIQYANGLLHPVSISNNQNNITDLDYDYQNNNGQVSLKINSIDEKIKNGSLCTIYFEITNEIEKYTDAKFSISNSNIIGKDGQDVAHIKNNHSVKLVGKTSSTENLTLTLNKSEITINEGETYQLVSTVKPETTQNKNVLYKSLNTAIATVNEKGQIKAIKKGKTTITATINNITLNCIINVNPKSAITKIIVDEDDIDIKVNSNYKLKVAVLPDDASINDLVYTSTNPNIALVDRNGNIKSKEIGFTIIEVHTKDKSILKKVVVNVSNDSLNKVTVKGKLLDEKNKPLSNRQLELVPGNIKLKTDNEGYFVFNDIDVKDYSLYLYDKSLSQISAKGILTTSNNKNEIEVTVHKNNLIISDIIEIVDKNIPIKSVSFATKEVRIKEKENYQLIYIIEPKEAVNQALKFQSKDENIVAVQQNGAITGKSKGMTSIKVLSPEGKILDECIVHVDGADSNEKSYLIIIIEGIILLCLVLWFYLRYRKYRKIDEKK